MQPANKKEVSCKAFIPVFLAAKKKNISLNSILEGTPYKLEYLLNKRERIEWWVWCKFISNSRAFFTPSEFEDMGANFVKNGSYVEGMLGAFFLFSTIKIARVLNKIVFSLGDSMFSCVKSKTEYLDKNKIRVTLFLEKGYEFCPEFFLISKGTWEQLLIQIGHKGSNVSLTLLPPNGVFNVSWKREDLLFKIRRGIRWLFNFRKVFVELTQSHDELRSQYNKLEESKILLQKQTTQLKTANEISTSIRQSLNINDILKTITEILIRETGFTFAAIHLFNDIDGNNIEINVELGENVKSIFQIKQEILIDEKIIGEIILKPGSEIDYREVNELINYLSPVINIAIHDSLVLRAIIDYKDNLEKKVVERTYQLQEAQQTQNRFFTNISHEFRTPLTLILGPAKQLKERITDNKSKEELDLIHRSAKKLNRLVDELLDISKIESGEMKLKARPLNLVTVVKELSLSFYSLAERKNIVFNLISPEDEIIVYIDKDKFDKILSNVLSNAFKFTPEGGRVDVEINRHPELGSGSLSFASSQLQQEIPKQVRNYKFVEISVRDTGIGIPNNQYEKIFDRFYQVDGSHTREQEGTGIGLALTKELMDLHKGKIEVESEESKGSTFRLIFPLSKEHLRPEEICEESLSQSAYGGLSKGEGFSEEIISTEETRTEKHNIGLKTETGKPLLLIVEDNSDVRKYISMILENHYQIIETKDGEEGLSKSFAIIPDLIISDIMMPKMDGFQLCSKLKTDPRTSHIPIIILTAKATMQDKVSGFELGADDYIMKPFEAEELKARIKNLIEQRRRLQEHFQKFGLFDISEKNITSIDQKFLEKAVAEINKHISDVSFGVELFAEDMSMSRSLLFKKINSLTGESPIDLVRRVRLNKAARLIEKNFGNISEIALEVGFNNPSYFSECFRKQFGVAPSQYHNKHNKK